MPFKQFKDNVAVCFGVSFLVLFLLFYYFNIYFFGVTQAGNHYLPVLDDHFNYIRWLREGLLAASSLLLKAFGFTSIHNGYELLVVGHQRIVLVYSCLGLGVMSFFAAFVITYPKKWKAKLAFLLAGLLSIQILNICRLVLLALYWDRTKARIIDHHVIFDVLIYIFISASLYLWVNNKASNPDVKNRPVHL